MRIIGGSLRGRRLKSPPGTSVRPTSDRLRETLFNIISARVPGSIFLDLCAGSGAIGMEALSRGADHVVFVELSRRSCAVIVENLEALGLGENATLVNKEATAALKRLEAAGRRFDIVFLDPPYASDTSERVLPLLGSGELLAPEGLVIAEHRSHAPMGESFGELRAFREVRQGDSALVFYSRV